MLSGRFEAVVNAPAEFLNAQRGVDCADTILNTAAMCITRECRQPMCARKVKDTRLAKSHNSTSTNKPNRSRHSLDNGNPVNMRRRPTESRSHAPRGNAYPCAPARALWRMKNYELREELNQGRLSLDNGNPVNMRRQANRIYESIRLPAAQVGLDSRLTDFGNDGTRKVKSTEIKSTRLADSKVCFRCRRRLIDHGAR